MKLAAFPLLLSSVLLLSHLAAGAASDAVVDSDGNALKRGTKYYILPRPGFAGGLRLARRNERCPLYVAVASSEVDLGLPVSFHPADKNDDTVRLSKDTNFVFNAFTICLQSVWQLQGADEATGRYYVSMGGTIGSPGKETLRNWFKIERFEVESSNYKLVFCPEVCEFCRPICGDLGIFAEDGKEWLGFDGLPLSVEFIKA